MPSGEVVLVTGAAGFVGSHLVQHLVRTNNSKPVIAWRRPDTGHNQRPVTPPWSFGDSSTVQWNNVDLLDREGVTREIAEVRPSQIYHLAGAANVRDSWRHSALSLETNVRGTQFLLEAISSARLSTRVLIPGSALVYQPSTDAIAEDHPIGPVSPYGLSKLAQEMLGGKCADSELAILFPRSFTHLGPGQNPSYAVSSFASQIAKIETNETPPVIRVGSLEALRDLTDVRDTVDAYRALMARGVSGRPYNVCSGHAHRMSDVLEALLSQTDVDVAVHIDQKRLRPKDNDLLLGDPSRINAEIGWYAKTELEETLRDTLNYWRDVVRL